MLCGSRNDTVSAASLSSRCGAWWATVDAAPADCVLIADPAGAIVGSGITGLPHPGVDAPGAGWNAVAPPGSAGLVVLVGDGGTLDRIAD